MKIAIGCVNHTPTVLFATSLSFHEMFRLTFVFTNAHGLRYGKGGILDFAQFRELMIVLIGDTGNKDSTAESFKLIAKGHPVRTQAHVFFLALVRFMHAQTRSRSPLPHTRASHSLPHAHAHEHTHIHRLSLLGVASARQRAYT
jgi:phosphatidate phosphatase APP1